MRPRAKATIDTLQEVVYEISIGTKLNDLDLCLVSSRFAEKNRTPYLNYIFSPNFLLL